MKLSTAFYTRPDVVQISRDLLGKILYTNIEDRLCAGRIVETEAYAGENDKACHAHLQRRTQRTEIMFHEGGVAYVYLVYGMHALFNIVTNVAERADAVLVRAVEPLEGIETMQQRRKLEKANHQLTAGPGRLTQAMGIQTSFYGTDLQGDRIWIEDDQFLVSADQIIASPRVGIDYAGEDALLPWRFRIKNNPWCSPAK